MQSVPQRVTRVLRDLLELAESTEGFELCSNQDISLDGRHEIKFLGPAKSPYDGRSLAISVTFPPRYPFEPPNLILNTPIYHPNIDTSGRICLDLLKMPPKGTWRPTVSLSSVMQAIRILLCEPNPDDPLMPEIAHEYVNNRALFNSKAKRDHLDFSSRSPPSSLGGGGEGGLDNSKPLGLLSLKKRPNY